MMQKIRNKKGISHIEVILSFVMFVGFVIFMLAVLNPFKIFEGGESYLDVLERAIKNYSNVEVNFLSLRLNETVSLERCFHFKYNSTLENVSVRNESYDFIEAYSEMAGGGGQSLEVVGGSKIKGKAIQENNQGKIKKEIRIYINGTGKFFYIYFYDEFNRSEVSLTGMDCTGLDKENYTLGLFRSYNMISYIKLKNLKEEYNSSYTRLKMGFGLPAGKDFSFNARDTLNNIIPEIKVIRKIPKGIKVLAKDIPIQLAYPNGTLQYAILNIMVW